MCGIAGLVATDARHTPDSSLKAVQQMCNALTHRGPDGEGLTQALNIGSGGHVVLGHRRLSIVDITGGAQPMMREGGGIWLTFNGEIYNFPELRSRLIDLGQTFMTQSDTEVVLAAYIHYGADCVKLFNGMFSLAIWDAEKQFLFMARDAYGKKPFYFRHEADRFIFASEIKAFASLVDTPPLNLEEDTLRDCTLLRYVPGERTLYNNIFKLEPGTFATFDPGTKVLKKTRFHTHPDSRPREKGSAAEIGLNSTEPHKRFLSLLDDSVASRLNCDVPFGAFLSGGIDSSVVVALMTKHTTSPVRTFSIGFEQKDLSELDSAKLIAEAFGTDHHERIIEPEDFIKYLPEAVFYRDGPVSEPSDIPILLLSKMAAEKVKMVLTGEGSDEVLGGYPKHVFERYSAYTSMIPQGLRKKLRNAVRRQLPAHREKVKTALVSLLADNSSERMQRWFGTTDLEIRDELFSNGSRFNDGCLDEHAGSAGFVYDGGSELRNILAFDQTVWLPNNLLERGDRMTMAAGLEARMPFLDVRLASFVSQLPDEYRVHRRKTKWILRQAAREVIPKAIIDRKKLGFKVPVEQWFRKNLSEYLHAYIAAPGACLHEYMSKQVILRLFEEHLNNRQNHEKILWTLLNLEVWLRQLHGFEPFPSPEVDLQPEKTPGLV